MENIKIILYSLIQGATEFLPISSSAHLYLIQGFFKWNDNILLLALGAHLGTFLAVLFYNRKLFMVFRKGHYFLLATISSIPVITIGGLFGIFGFNYYNSNLFVIAIACIVGGILLDISDNQIKSKDKNTISYKESILIGIFQVLALIPGMSRSGCVITMMRYLGINRVLCIKYSLLTGLPVLFAACSFGLYKAAMNNNNVDITKLFLVILITLFTASITINFFLKWVKKFSFRIFSIYRIILGILILVYLY